MNECTLSGGAQPNRARQAHGASERRQACGAQAQAGADFAGRRRGAYDEDIATSVGVGGSTVYRTKEPFVLGNLELALGEEPRLCCGANAWTGASPPKSSWYPRSPPGNDSVMSQEPASNGCSHPQKPAPKWVAPIPRPLASQKPGPKSHNHCAAVLVAPAKTPDAVVARLNTEVEVALRRPEMAAKLAIDSSEPLPSSPERFAEFLNAERAKWGALIREAGSKLE
jgi:Tripartite tricarboxylate transporter family receptor